MTTWTTTRIAGAAALGALLGIALYVAFPRPSPLPSADSDAYVEVTRAFYRGLAALEAGLVDDAKTGFTRATGLVPAEPASWANLGLAHLRVAEFDQAATAIEQAARLTPASAPIAMLQGALEGARGRVDAATAHLRRAVDLAPDSVRARFALAEATQRGGGPDADAQSAALFDEILARVPDNLAVLVERVRVATRLGNVEAVRQGVSRLRALSAAWPPEVLVQLDGLDVAARAGDLQAAARAVAFLRNVLARVAAFREDLAVVSVPAELLAEPLDRFLLLDPADPAPSPPDMALAFERQTLGTQRSEVALAATLGVDTPPVVLTLASDGVRRLDSGALVFPAVRQGQPAPLPAALLALDWNHDFLTDLLVPVDGRPRLLLQQADGSFVDATPGGGAMPDAEVVAAWAADVEMDGDLDVVLALRAGDPVVLRNNGDGSWQRLAPFPGVPGARGFVWGDLDSDGDPDAVLVDSGGTLHVFTNRQAGQFTRRSAPGQSGVAALALGDLNADGLLDLVTLDGSGTIRMAWLDGDAWRTTETAARWDGVAPGDPGGARVLLADLDNNGALDLVASGPSGTRIWLADEMLRYQPLTALDDARVFAVADLTGDGLLDLVGVASGQPLRLAGTGTRGYHWQVIRAQAQTAAGDQRVNAFGVGGEVEVRSGLLVQKQVLTGAPSHFGLGTRTAVDVARIVWPNGVMQAEFDVAADRAIVATQRLKGSCPWLFTDDGTAMQFVTDILWRSPLGLRINAQDTAGVTQTEDWVKIRGDQLRAREGRYDVRITAELWETHYFDHVSLIAVDHPDGTEVFVDERFARTPPPLTVHATGPLRPLAGAWDDAGRDVSELLRARDDRHLAGFERGRFQGVARDHWVEFEIDRRSTAGGPPRWLVAQGWVYPTDSSINVAIAQGTSAAPYGLALEARTADGRWRAVAPDIGFPAGKRKTMLIDLSDVPADATRLRLRTNMEVYWDALATAAPAPADSLRTSRLPVADADLRYRGFSQTRTDLAAHAPELPQYARIANVTPRWRDLVGYHTRFGEVRELLTAVDDRYVIMNAGDELRLTFGEPPPPPAGWIRDYVFISDGWEKDGDFNTGFSQSVLPLPSHDRPDYAGPGVPLEHDPVYRRHREDWARFHTRFVAPERYLRGLRAY